MAIYRPKHFAIEELVPPDLMVGRSTEELLALFDPAVLIVADRLREDLGRVITVNTWKKSGCFSQRGARTDMNVGAKKSAHRVLFDGRGVCIKKCMALDCDVAGLSAESVRKHIMKNSSRYPEIKRMETGVNWVHFDTVPVLGVTGIYLFRK